MKKDKNSVGDIQTYSLAFYLKSDISKEQRKRYKKTLYTLNSIDGHIYILLGEDKFPYAETAALAIFDAKEDGKKNVVVPEGKNYIFLSSSDGENYTAEIVAQNAVDKDGLSVFAESYFRGFHYRISDDAKTLKKAYGKGISTTALLLIVLIILALSGAAFFGGIFGEKIQAKHQAPKPTVDAPTELEKENTRRKIDLKALEAVLSQISAIANGEENGTNNIENTRISNMSFPEPAEIIPEEPTYDEGSNTWVYTDERKKRGGFMLTFSTGTQKRYADISYSKKETYIYHAEESVTLEAYNNQDGVDEEDTPKVTVGCIEQAFEISNMEERGSERMRYSIDKDKKTASDPLALLLAIKKLLTECPAYLSSVTISDGDKSGSIYFYYRLNSENGSVK